MKEGSQIGEGGEVFMGLNGIKFLPLMVSNILVFLRLRQCETIEQNFKPFVCP